MSSRNDRQARQLTNTAKTLRAIGALVIREMITRYGRSWGGYIWAIVEPVGIILVLSIAFSQIVKTPAIGTSFVLFYATGYIPFHFFLEVSSNVGNSIQVNRQLLYLPSVTAIDAAIARFVLSILTLLVVSLIVFTGILYFTSEQVRISLDHIFLAFTGGAIAGLGIGMVNVVVFEYVPIWRQLWGIISRPLFIISGVFFTYDSMPEHLREILWWNPLIHVVGESRKGFYPTYDGAYIALWYPIGLGLALTLIGAVLIIRNRSRLIDSV